MNRAGPELFSKQVFPRGSFQSIDCYMGANPLIDGIFLFFFQIIATPSIIQP
jgi:hypothetical protein